MSRTHPTNAVVAKLRSSGASAEIDSRGGIGPCWRAELARVSTKIAAEVLALDAVRFGNLRVHVVRTCRPQAMSKPRLDGASMAARHGFEP